MKPKPQSVKDGTIRTARTCPACKRPMLVGNQGSLVSRESIGLSFSLRHKNGGTSTHIWVCRGCAVPEAERGEMERTLAQLVRERATLDRNTALLDAELAAQKESNRMLAEIVAAQNKKLKMLQPSRETEAYLAELEDQIAAYETGLAEPSHLRILGAVTLFYLVTIFSAYLAWGWIS